MADQLDSRPVFTIVMGCNGSGKSAWKRANYDRLPDRYFDQDSIAGGIGDWDSEDARQRTRRYVDEEVGTALQARMSFGIESTYSGRPGREMVERVRRANYRIEGIYIGTESPEINVARIERRVLEHTGHRVDPGRVPERYRYSLSNLRRTVEQFDQLEVLDNSRPDSLGDSATGRAVCARTRRDRLAAAGQRNGGVVRGVGAHRGAVARREATAGRAAATPGGPGARPRGTVGRNTRGGRYPRLFYCRRVSSRIETGFWVAISLLESVSRTPVSSDWLDADLRSASTLPGTAPPWGSTRRSRRS